MAATVHLIGCTFYAVFASGELQPWAEPTLAEQKAWEPTAGTHPAHPAHAPHAETSFVSILMM